MSLEEWKNSITECVKSGFNSKVDKSAEEFAKHLKDNDLTTTKIRGIYGTVKKMEMSQKLDEGELMRLKPRLAYDAKRGKHGNKDLKDILTVGILEVVKNDSIDGFVKFKNFANFFEAVLAYHKAYE